MERAPLGRKTKMCRDVREREMLASNHAETPLKRNNEGEGYTSKKHPQTSDFGQTDTFDVILAFPFRCEASTHKPYCISPLSLEPLVAGSMKKEHLDLAL